MAAYDSLPVTGPEIVPGVRRCWGVSYEDGETEDK